MVENHAGWGWVETLVSIVTAIVTGIAGWFHRRFKGLDDRLNAVVGITVDQGREITMLQAQDRISDARHQDNLDRLERIDAKQDAQMEILSDIRMKCGRH